MKNGYIHIPYDRNNSVEVEENYIIDNYVGKDLKMGHSVIRSHLNGKHPLMKNTKSNRTYYFISGHGKFMINGKTVEVKAEDMLVIPKNTLYSFEGEFDAILISVPAFDPKYDVIYRD